MGVQRDPYLMFNTNMSYRKNALKIAKDLCHPESVIEKIKNAKSSEEIATIMFVAAQNIGED